VSDDLRVVALAAVAATAALFLIGVRRVFRRAPAGHGYSASLSSGAVLVTEAVAIAVRPVPASRAAAAVAALAGAAALFRWAARANRARPLGLAFAASVPEHVQTRGPYAFVRHPFYASYLLAFAGGWVASASPWVAPAFALGLWTYWRAARREERAFLASPVADAYRTYALCTGMFLPRSFGRAPLS
jgi:protein-S-isoprenylcysteine O-methyltransferase Ste14